MTTAVDRNGLRLLDREECLHLLAGKTFGRIGVTFGALPLVLPVNYRLVDDEIVFRTGTGTKLDAATCNTIVAFEVDDIDPLTHTGWSVVATGEARKITDPVELARLAEACIPHWAHADVDGTVAVSTTMLSGRRVGLP
jgi:nitroimidazol reductase NimA-like FMN-containing flavoprotein (pyridoxamine 5'-phosphate oxidase superfamily)